MDLRITIDRIHNGWTASYFDPAKLGTNDKHEETVFAVSPTLVLARVLEIAGVTATDVEAKV